LDPSKKIKIKIKEAPIAVVEIAKAAVNNTLHQSCE
jgi:hypothetical protein